MKGLNDRQRRFCELLVSGMAAGRAYEAAGYGSKANVADSAAERLLRNVEIASYVQELRKAHSLTASMSTEQAIDVCVRVVNSKPSEAGPDNPLCELKMSKAGPYYAFPPKMAALERLSKMLGFDKPSEIKGDITVTVHKKW